MWWIKEQIVRNIVGPKSIDDRVRVGTERIDSNVVSGEILLIPLSRIVSKDILQQFVLDQLQIRLRQPGMINFANEGMMIMAKNI